MSLYWRVGALWLVVTAAVASVAEAQSASAPGSAAPSPGASAAGATGSGVSVAIIVLVLATIALIAAIAKITDLRRKREEKTIELQTQISEALLRDRNVGVSVTPTVQIPFWKGSPARIELTGQVASPQSRQAALRIAQQEASRIRQDFETHDRMVEVTPGAARTA